jgi:hypothetical protein
VSYIHLVPKGRSGKNRGRAAQKTAVPALLETHRCLQMVLMHLLGRCPGLPAKAY